MSKPDPSEAMVTTLYSSKGGAGVSTVAALMALAAGGRGQEVVLVDLCGDQPYLFGAYNDPPGITEWARKGCAAGGLDPLLRPLSSVDYDGEAALLPLGGDFPVPSRRGTGPQMAAEPAAVAEALGRWMRGRGHVIVDAGNLADPRDEPGRHWLLRRAVAEASDHRVLVTRQCVLGLRTHSNMDIEPTGVVLVAQQGSSLRRSDIERAAEAPVVGTLPVAPETALAAASGVSRVRLDDDVLVRIGSAYSELVVAAARGDHDREGADGGEPHLGLVHDALT